MAYEEFLNEVVRFLVEHPTEIIVVQVSHSNGLIIPMSATVFVRCSGGNLLHVRSTKRNVDFPT
jgi:hypothetical protein